MRSYAYSSIPSESWNTAASSSLGLMPLNDACCSFHRDRFSLDNLAEFCFIPPAMRGESSRLMINDIVDLLDLDDKHELSSLQPPPESVVMSIAARYPDISKQYLEFLRAVGTGSTTREFYIYQPESASYVEQHTSFQLYQSASRELYGPRSEGHPVPADAVAIADSGASWRYCLCPSLGAQSFVSTWLAQHSRRRRRTSSLS